MNQSNKIDEPIKPLSVSPDQGKAIQERVAKVFLTRPKLTILHAAPGAPRRITALAYGMTGIGKTTFGGTFPRPFFLDMRGNVASTLRKKEPAYIIPAEESDLITFLALAPTDEFKDYDSYILDTGTEMPRIIMQSLLKNTNKEKAGIGEWGYVIEKTRQIFRRLVTENPTKHILVTAQEQTVKDEDLGKIYVKPSFPGKLADEVGELFEGVYHLRMAFAPGPDGKPRKQRLMLTEPEDLYPAKDCWNCLSRLEVPDFNVIWDKISKS